MKVLEQTVRVAALPANKQIECFSQLFSGNDESVVIADQIALDFGNWCRWALQGYQAPVLTDEQRSSLMALDARLDRMSDADNHQLWTNHALRHSPEWEEARSDARKIMDVFGWSIDEK